MADLNNQLSERELEILKLVATGASNKEIASQLVISVNTVKVHLRNIFSKLGVSSRTEASLYFHRFQSNLNDKGLSTQSDDLGYDIPDAEIRGLAMSATYKYKRSPFQGKIFNILLVFILILFLVIVSIQVIRMFANRAASTQIISDVSSDGADSPASRWESRKDLPEPRSNFASVFYENQIYIIGGENAKGSTSDVYIYIPETDTWMMGSSKPTSVSYTTGTVLGGKIYIPGGQLESGEVTNIVEIYDPGNDTWEIGAPMPTPLSAYASVVFEGQIYLFGGWNGQEFVDLVLRYNPENQTWGEMTAMPLKSGYAGAGVAGGKIYIFGGFDGENPINQNLIYSPTRDQSDENPWQEAAPLPEARYAMGYAVVADVIHIIGGDGDEIDVFSQMEYRPLEDRWQLTENPLAEPWSHLGVVSVGTQLYALGGLLNGEMTQRNLAYQVIFVVLIPVVR